MVGQNSKVFTREQLTNLITIGMSGEKVGSIFGPPTSIFKTGSNTTLLLYSFPVEFKVEPLHLSGFTIRLENNIVTKWMPAEAETGMPMAPNVTKSFGKQSFEVFLGTNQLTGSSNRVFKNGGSSAYNIKAAPKLTFTADMFFDLSGSQAGEGTITLRLNQTDALKLGDLTETNVGRTLLITSQGKVIASPRITGRIDSQAIIFKIKDPTVLNGL